jgi:hypothetical protein
VPPIAQTISSGAAVFSRPRRIARKNQNTSTGISNGCGSFGSRRASSSSSTPGTTNAIIVATCQCHAGAVTVSTIHVCGSPDGPRGNTFGTSSVYGSLWSNSTMSMPKPTVTPRNSTAIAERPRTPRCGTRHSSSATSRTSE